MENSKFKILFLCLTLFAAAACARREPAGSTSIITTTKPDSPPTKIFSTEPPPAATGGTVIIATAPGATPAPSTPGPTAPAPVPPPVAAASTVTGAVVSATVPLAPPVPPPPTAVEVNTVSTTEKVGLLECDTYVDRYVSCINRNVPADRQGPLVRGLESNIRRWQAMMSSATGRTDAGNDCQRAFDQTKQAMTPYGCTWE